MMLPAMIAHVMLLLAPMIVFTGTPLDVTFVLTIAALVSLSVGEQRLSCIESNLPRFDRVLASVSGLGLLAIAWLSLYDRGPTNLVGGVLLLMIGIGLRLTAMRVLGARFRSTLRPTLGARVTTGIFRLRHPSEIGLVAFGFGLVLLRGSLHAGAVALFLLLPASLIRVSAEERAMTHTS